MQRISVRVILLSLLLGLFIATGYADACDQDVFYQGESRIEFSTSHQATFQDLGVAGHVNSDRIVGFFLSHFFEGLRQNFRLGVAELSKLPYVVVLRRTSIEFERTLFAEEFEIRSRVHGFSKDGFTVKARIIRHHRTVAAGDFYVTCINHRNQKVDCPDDLRDRFYPRIKTPPDSLPDFQL